MTVGVVGLLLLVWCVVIGCVDFLLPIYYYNYITTQKRDYLTLLGFAIRSYDFHKLIAPL